MKLVFRRMWTIAANTDWRLYLDEQQIDVVAGLFHGYSSALRTRSRLPMSF